MAKSGKNLIWIDLEMTGLDTENDQIIEIATIVTDKDLNILGEGPVYAIHQPDGVLDKMDEWNQKQHRKSGLYDRVRASEWTVSDAEAGTLDFLQRYCDKGKSPMCGNSICQDRRFLHRQMPQLEQFFHYRNLDVSTFKELAKRWAPKIYNGLHKEAKHLALDDIKESIEELQYYRKNWFKPFEGGSEGSE